MIQSTNSDDIYRKFDIQQMRFKFRAKFQETRHIFNYPY